MLGEGQYLVQQNGIYAVVVPVNTKESLNIVYKNELTEQTSMHAHGLSNTMQYMDGVPYISSLPIQPKRLVHYTYQMTADSAGTHYIHSQ